MKNCKFCGVELTDINWFPSRKKKYDYICNSCSKKKQHTYYIENKQHVIDTVNRWTDEHHEQKINTTKSWRMRLKLDVLSHYSNGTLKCVRCKFSDIRALTIDHINGDGCIQRKALFATYKGGHGFSFYKWLKDNGYPKGYQTFCRNCQAIKAVENEEYNKGGRPKKLLPNATLKINR